jgi:hypothetical protein
MSPSDTLTTTWSVDIHLSEHEGMTRAVAKLHTNDPTKLVGTGFARLNPTDRDVPEIGEELAAARALHALADRLLGAAVGDISDVTHESVSLEDVR